MKVKIHSIYNGFQIVKLWKVSQTMANADCTPMYCKSPSFRINNVNGARLGFDHKTLKQAKHFIDDSLIFEGNRFDSLTK